MAGGTGGHIFPALAVADCLKKKYHCEVFWLGAAQGLEETLVGKQFPFFSIPVVALRNKGIGSRLLAIAKLGWAVLRAGYLIKKLSPTVVVGFGGFVSGPGGLAATLLRKPLVIHEQNTLPGLTNRYLSRIAKTTLQAFPHTFPAKIAAQTVGNPVRANILSVVSVQERFSARTGPLRLLVLGGSQGAQCINKGLLAFLKQFSAVQLPLQIWVQTGKSAYAELCLQYAFFPQVLKVSDFIEDMVSAYSWADLVLCRAGALTLSELAAVGLGALLVPYARSADQHQLKNAQYRAQLGGVEVIEEACFTPESFKRKLEPYLADRQKAYELALLAYNPHAVRASVSIAEHIINSARKKASTGQVKS
eukprot:TRINITY_DN26310_c0_g1_i1.p1 TRINITY_DN26310_c0_g1~~TRINITY_DN26310_c0_g1_i1.p1  ORF type:complete len:363 (+),score=-66.34 TRINITY_DN26310_c0_g1_i1:313-1401(+)